MELPQNLYQNLKSLFGDDFHEFYALKDEPSYKGLRVNTLKCSVPKLLKYGITKSPSPFCASGFYISGEEKLGNHPLHHAGAFYIQEPSATSAVEVLNPTVGDYVLDLCAAPGGKSTQIAAKLSGSGLIWSNEIIGKRANILLSNFERMGIHNCVVSSCHPDILCDSLECAFDKVLVDAPCSGEGMMRHDASICEDWSSENVEACARRQLKILDSAAKALRPGGILVYSTCTFAPEEDEQTVAAFLEDHPDFVPEPVEAPWFTPGENASYRMWPHKLLGEGHFAAVLRKTGGETGEIPELKGEKLPKQWESFAKELGITLPAGKAVSFGQSLFWAPEGMPDIQRLKVLRPGLELGTVKKDRFEPAHALALWLSSCANMLTLDPDSEEMKAYLHGDVVPSGMKGWCLVRAGSYSIGWGKGDGRVLKNHYPKGLRR